MNKGIAVAIGVIGWVSLVTFIGCMLWILIGSGLMPWWIAVPPALVVGLIGLGVVNKLVGGPN